MTKPRTNTGVGQSKPRTASEVLCGAPNPNDPYAGSTVINLDSDLPDKVVDASPRPDAVVQPPEPPLAFEFVKAQKIEERAEIAVLTQAWNVLKQALRPTVIKGLESAAVMLKLPEWQLALGLLNYLHGGASLYCPVTDPEWLRAGSNEVSLIDFRSVCQNKKCGKTFIAESRGQLYCCNACGMELENLHLNQRQQEAKEQKMAKDRIDEETMMKLEAARRRELGTEVSA